MDTEQLIREIEALPDDDRQQVADFIAFLRHRAKRKRPNRTPNHPPLAEDPFIGMWKDREDMKDGASWVRQLRQSEWSRHAPRAGFD